MCLPMESEGAHCLLQPRIWFSISFKKKSNFAPITVHICSFDEETAPYNSMHKVHNINLYYRRQIRIILISLSTKSEFGINPFNPYNMDRFSTR